MRFFVCLGGDENEFTIRIKTEAERRDHMKKLETMSCEELMTTLMRPMEFLVDGLITQGLFILAGNQKVGKSWLALDICLSIAKGEKVLGRETIQGTALYLCLEDSYIRMQNRVYELTDEPTDKLYFSLLANTIGNGLEEQIRDFKSEHSDLKIVVIDTLQKVRSGDEQTYASDYREMSVLKNLAAELGIAILLVHHLRKCRDSDPFKMISGTSGITGCADGSFVLKREDRSQPYATLSVVGRDIEACDIALKMVGSRWIVTAPPVQKQPDIFAFVLHDFMVGKAEITTTATELSAELEKQFHLTIPCNMISKKLMQHGVELEGYGVSFRIERSHGKRKLRLYYDRSGDSGDGRMMWGDNICPADTQVPANVLDTSSELGDGLDKGDSKGGSGDGSEYAIVDGIPVPITRVNINDVIQQCAERLRAKIADERGIVVPEFKLAP